MKLPTRNRITAIAMKTAKLVLIEALIPGGTLLVLAILLAGGRLSFAAGRLAACLFGVQWGKSLHLSEVRGTSMRLRRSR